MEKVMIDPGHGGEDPGALGYGREEKETNLLVALEAARQLAPYDNDIKVRLTRNNDTYLSLAERCDLANRWGADAFISLHADWSSDPAVKGHHAIHSIHSKPGQGGNKLARLLVDEVGKATGRAYFNRSGSDAGIWTRESSSNPGSDWYGVIRMTAMSAVILERGFMSSKADNELLFDQGFLQKQAEGIVNAILKYCGLASKKQSDIKLVVNGNELFTDVPPQIIDGRTMVPVRWVAEALGANVRWEGSSRTVYVDSHGSMQEKELPKIETKVIEGTTVHIITALPKDIKVRVIKGKLNRDGVNGGYLDQNLNPLGIVVIDGKILADRASWRPPRTCFAIDAAGTPKIIPDVAKAEDLISKGIKHALGAGPNLLPEVSHSEGFQDDIMKSITLRSAVGITDYGEVKLVTTTPTTLSRLSAIMREVGCTQAMNLDGGGSTSMCWKGKEVVQGRAISTAILVEKEVQ